MPVNEYRLKVYRGPGGLAAIRAHWRHLVPHMQAKGFWHYHEWYESYLEHLEPEPERLFFFVLTKAEEVVAILPFKHQARYFKGVPLNVLELPRHAHIKLKDIIFPEVFQTQDAVDALMMGLQQLSVPAWDLIALHDLLPDSCALNVLSRMPVTKIIEPHDTCDSIAIGATAESIRERMSRQLKKSLKVSNKRAAAVGVLSSTVVRRPPELEEAFRVFLDLEASGWKGPGGTATAIRCSPALTGFYTSLVRKFGDLEKCEVALLALNAQPIAGTFSMIIDDTAYSLKIAYDESNANLSPGNLQREKLMLDYAGHPAIRKLNLVSGSSSPWHQRWNITSQKTYRLYLFNRSPKALMAFAFKKVKKKLKAVARMRSGTAGGNTRSHPALKRGAFRSFPEGRPPKPPATT